MQHKLTITNGLKSFEGLLLKGFHFGFLIFCILHFAFCIPVYSAPGTHTADYLNVDVGAKAVGMAGTQFGSEDDSFAPFYNPAFLSGITRKEVGVMHNEFFDDLRQEVITYAHPTRRFGNFAGAFNYFTFGEIKGFDEQGTPTGDLSATALTIQGSWGKIWDIYIGDNTIKDLSTGASFKVLREDLAGDNSAGFAIDLGFSYPLKTKLLYGLKTAGSITNIGSGLSGGTLPRKARLGLARSFWGEAFTVTADGILLSGESLYPAFAVQYRIRNIVSVRLGYKGDNNLDQQFTYGVGFENPRFRLDYAFTPFGDLGDTHRVSVIYRFGENNKRLTADKQLRQKVKQAKTLYAQGLLVDGYMASLQVQRVAPWMDDNNKLLNKIHKDFRQLEASDRREKLKNQVAALFSRAEKFFEEGNLINSQLEFQAILGLDPKHKAAQGYIRQIEGQFLSLIESFYRTGMIAFAEGNYLKAKEEFEKVLVIKPDHKEAKEQLNKCSQVLERRKKEVAQAVQRDLVTRTYLQGLENFRRRKYRESLSLFTRVLKLNPDHQEAKRYASLSKETLFQKHMDSGKVLISRGRWEDAIQDLKSAVNYRPGSGTARRMLEDSRRKWDLQKKVKSQNYYKQGLEAFLSGDKKTAQSIWEKALELDPESEEVRRGLSRIK